MKLSKILIILVCIKAYKGVQIAAVVRVTRSRDICKINKNAGDDWYDIIARVIIYIWC